MENELETAISSPWLRPFSSGAFSRQGVKGRNGMQDTLSVVYQSCFSERNKLEVFQSVFFSTSTPLRSLGKSMLISMSSSEGSTALKLPSSLGSLVWRIMIGTAIPNFNLHVLRSLNTTCFCSANQNDPTRLVLFGSAFNDRIFTQGCRRGMQFQYWIKKPANRH